MGCNLSAGQRGIRAMVAMSCLFLMMELMIVTEGVLRWSAAAVCATVAGVIALTAWSGWCPIVAIFGLGSRPAAS